jgi:hypothetical protein
MDAIRRKMKIVEIALIDTVRFCMLVTSQVLFTLIIAISLMPDNRTNSIKTIYGLKKEPFEQV